MTYSRNQIIRGAIRRDPAWVGLGRSLGLPIGLALAAALSLLPGRAAGSDVVRVRVPAKDVIRFFPPGTELRVLAPRNSSRESRPRARAGG